MLYLPSSIDCHRVFLSPTNSRREFFFPTTDRRMSKHLMPIDSSDKSKHFLFLYWYSISYCLFYMDNFRIFLLHFPSHFHMLLCTNHSSDHADFFSSALNLHVPHDSHVVLFHCDKVKRLYLPDGGYPHMPLFLNFEILLWRKEDWWHVKRDFNVFNKPSWTNPYLICESHYFYNSLIKT